MTTTEPKAGPASELATRTWKQALADRTDPTLVAEIDAYETQLELKRLGRIDDRLFAETRLRRGVYGQRYDNGQRHDGVASRTLPYPSGELTKGPHTMWDAPGMVRIKIPFGAVDAEQLDLLADLAEEVSDGILHVTTRQDIQLHFVHIDDTPDLMRRLAAAGITTREACGNSVRNVTACPLSGVCSDEAFDVSPYARALAYHLLGHKDAQDFGRKFKIAFSGCQGHACGLASMHDLGLVARVREVDGEVRRGFRFLVGGGLGAVPHQAKVLSEFIPEQDLLPTAQAICRIFARLGEKKNRARARIKFLVAKLGIEELRRLVAEELSTMPEDERWTAYLEELEMPEEASRQGAPLPPDTRSDEFERWRAHNAIAQRQPGYAVVTVALPLGDLTSPQARALADVARRYNRGHLRFTVEQNLVLRYVAEADLEDLHRDLERAHLAAPEAGTLVDVTACPGTDTCKLGISSSRGLAAELRRRIQETGFLHDEAVGGLRIKISGCFNSCGQHHVADLGFYGVSRKHDGRTVPHFQVVLGGQWQNNAGSYGLATVAVPSKRIPEVVRRLTAAYVEGRELGEGFKDFARRTGKAKLRELIDDLTVLPSYAEDRTLFSDWGDPREYTIGDLGVGECAGEVVPVVEFGLQASERKVFEAQIELDEGSPEQASRQAYEAMLQAAKALARSEDLDLPDDADSVVRAFEQRFVETGRFNDPFAGAKFANYLLAAHAEALEAANGANGAPASDGSNGFDPEYAHRRIEEAQLFIEAAHACYSRMSAT
ncbi:MAG TPA: nitrite/sulfite reductase [Thermoanaerobaculia bacterium]|nr:nitrite/sulfite reductase [Thermoanaerobaculia bacterium]